MRTRSILFAATFGIGSLEMATPSQSRGEIELAMAADFIGGGPFPTTNSRWIAVVGNGTSTTAVDTTVEVSEIPHRCTGSATRVKATNAASPVFMVRGASLFNAGPLDAVFSGHRFIYPGESISLKLGSGTWFGLHAYGSATPDGISSYQIEITQGSKRQRLAELPVIDLDGKPQLIWAGDLDRDKSPDLLFDLTTSYAGNRYVLFISSSAGVGQVVGEAATFHVAGC